MGFIPSGQIQDGSITTAKLANNAVTSGKLAAVLSADLLATDKLAADALVIGIIAGSTTGYVPNKAKGDAFTVAAGHETTIDVTGGAGNTTAYFSTADKRYESNAAPVTDAHAKNVGDSAGHTAKCGMRILVGASAIILRSITKASTQDSTMAYILNATGSTILASAAYSGDIATFNYPLAAATSYVLASDKAGASYTVRAQGGAVTYPVSGTNLSWTASYFDETIYTTYSCGLESVSTSIISASTTIKSLALPTLNGVISQIKLSTYGLNLPAGSSATFDLDINGDGAYELTAQAVDAWIATAQTLAGAKVRVNLTNAGSGLEYLQGWVIQVI